MRVSYSFALRDQNRLVYQDDKQFTESLPVELRPAMERHFARFQVSVADYGALFEQLHAKHHDKERVKIQLAPANLHWCSDAALTMLADGIVNLTRSSRPSWPLSLERGQPYRGAKDFSVPNRRATDGRRIPPLLKLTMPLSVSNPLRRPGPVAAPN